MRPWKWMAFTNPARKDGLVLHHWRRSQDEGKDYPFARWHTNHQLKSRLQDNNLQVQQSCGGADLHGDGVHTAPDQPWVEQGGDWPLDGLGQQVWFSPPLSLIHDYLIAGNWHTQVTPKFQSFSTFLDSTCDLSSWQTDGTERHSAKDLWKI